MAILLLLAVLGLISGELGLTGTPPMLVVLSFVSSVVGLVRAYPLLRDLDLERNFRKMARGTRISILTVIVTNSLSLLGVLAFGFSLDHWVVVLLGLLSPWFAIRPDLSKS